MTRIVPLLEESQLLAAVATDDRAAFTQLYSTYLTDLQRYIFLFTRSEEMAEELVQQVFIKIWEQRTQLPAVLSFRAYLYRTAKNLVLDEVRHQQRQRHAYAELQPTLLTTLLPADSALQQRQSYEYAQQLIRQLPPKRRQIFLLRTQEELSLDEIAQRLSISKSVVKKQLYTAVKHVKKHLVLRGDVVAQLGVGLLLLAGG